MTDDTRASFNTIRTDHTGGLIRPQWLRDLYDRYYEGAVSLEEVRAGQDVAVREVIARQEDLGFAVVNDGEFRRIGGFQESFGGAVTGFDALPPDVHRSLQAVPSSRREARPASGRIETGLPAPRGQGRAIVNRLPVKERLKLVKNIILDEYRLASAVSSNPVKVTLIGPDRISQRFEHESSHDVYTDMDEFMEDVIAIERQMIAEVVAAGCRYVQIDEPGYTAYVDQPLLAQMRARGEDPLANLQRSIRADNAVIAGFPGVTFGVHICRGGSGGRGGAGPHREGSYDSIAERVFSQLNFDRYLLEYDSEAAGTFEAIRFFPKGKTAVLGLLSNNGQVVESADYLKRRLEEASQFLPLAQLAICPRCGMRDVTEEVQWAKLAMIQKVAHETWANDVAAQVPQ
jgi:5-methyltetrahydropteroyltriglutamate--homocysteine methyltransferase